MREENGYRLKDTTMSQSDINYIHYYYYHNDLFVSIDKYVKGKTLDIGCGNKPYRKNIEKCSSEYFGCDIVQSSENVVDIICYANSIPLDDETFDTVISTQTIEHIEDPQGLVNEAFRLLKKQGSFIISGPMYWPLHEEPYDFFRYTKHGFKFLLEKAGFEVVDIKSNGGKWSVAGMAIINALFPYIWEKKGIKGIFLRLLLRMLGGLKGLNKLFINLDNEDKDYSNTMNYVVIAKKMGN